MQTLYVTIERTITTVERVQVAIPRDVKLPPLTPADYETAKESAMAFVKAATQANQPLNWTIVPEGIHTSRKDDFRVGRISTSAD